MFQIRHIVAVFRTTTSPSGPKHPIQTEPIAIFEFYILLSPSPSFKGQRLFLQNIMCIQILSSFQKGLLSSLVIPCISSCYYSHLSEGAECTLWPPKGEAKNIANFNKGTCDQEAYLHSPHDSLNKPFILYIPYIPYIYCCVYLCILQNSISYIKIQRFVEPCSVVVITVDYWLKGPWFESSCFQHDFIACVSGIRI